MEIPLLQLIDINLSIIEKKKGIEIHRNLINNLNLEINAHEYVVILGDSGSGKTTLLDIIAGFILPNDKRKEMTKIGPKSYLKYSGKVFIDGINVSNLGPAHRQVGLVMQRFTLYEHMDIKGNLLFPLKNNALKESRIRSFRKIVNILRKVSLTNRDIKNRKPEDLSGGQRQRIAIAKMLLREPKIRLFDEAFSHLDFKLRNKLRNELIICPLKNEIEEKDRHVVIFVSHDLNDATTADQILYFFKEENEIPVIPKNRKIIRFDTKHQIFASTSTKKAFESFSDANEIQTIEIISTIKNKTKIK